MEERRNGWGEESRARDMDMELNWIPTFLLGIPEPQIFEKQSMQLDSLGS
jgi:hypothetical protein